MLPKVLKLVTINYVNGIELLNIGFQICQLANVNYLNLTSQTMTQKYHFLLCTISTNQSQTTTPVPVLEATEINFSYLFFFGKRKQHLTFRIFLPTYPFFSFESTRFICYYSLPVANQSTKCSVVTEHKAILY